MARIKVWQLTDNVKIAVKEDEDGNVRVKFVTPGRDAGDWAWHNSVISQKLRPDMCAELFEPIQVEDMGEAKEVTES